MSVNSFSVFMRGKDPDDVRRKGIMFLRTETVVNDQSKKYKSKANEFNKLYAPVLSIYEELKSLQKNREVNREYNDYLNTKTRGVKKTLTSWLIGKPYVSEGLTQELKLINKGKGVAPNKLKGLRSRRTRILNKHKDLSEKSNKLSSLNNFFENKGSKFVEGLLKYLDELETKEFVDDYYSLAEVVSILRNKNSTFLKAFHRIAQMNKNYEKAPINHIRYENYRTRQYDEKVYDALDRQMEINAGVYNKTGVDNYMRGDKVQIAGSDVSEFPSNNLVFQGNIANVDFEDFTSMKLLLEMHRNVVYSFREGINRLTYNVQPYFKIVRTKVDLNRASPEQAMRILNSAYRSNEAFETRNNRLLADIEKRTRKLEAVSNMKKPTMTQKAIDKERALISRLKYKYEMHLDKQQKERNIIEKGLSEGKIPDDFSDPGMTINLNNIDSLSANIIGDSHGSGISQIASSYGGEVSIYFGIGIYKIEKKKAGGIFLYEIDDKYITNLINYNKEKEEKEELGQWGLRPAVENILNAFDLIQLPYKIKFDENSCKLGNHKSARVHCLMSSLEKLGVTIDGKAMLDLANYMCDDRKIPTTCLPAIAKALDIGIWVKTLTPNSSNTVKYGDPTKFIAFLGYFDGHYFPILDIEKFSNKIFKVPKLNHKFITNTYDLVKFLSENQIIKRMSNETLMKFCRSAFDPEDPNVDIFQLVGCTPSKTIEKDEADFVEPPVVFGDFECVPSTEQHVEFYCRSLFRENNIDTKHRFMGLGCANQFVSYLKSLKRPKLHVVFHNLAYDANFMMKHFEYISGYCGTNKSLKRFTGHYTSGTERFKITFFDSLALTNMALKEFGESFGLDVKKEIFPYEFFNMENTKGMNLDTFVPLETIKPYIKEKEWEDFTKLASTTSSIPHIVNSKVELGKPCLIGDNFYPMRYCDFYCHQDVEVMMKGYNFMRNKIFEEFGLRSTYSTISTIAMNILKKNECYDGVSMLLGSLSRKIRRSCKGGIVAISGNTKKRVKSPMYYLDFVSLYLSTMILMGNLPSGKICKITQNLLGTTVSFQGGTRNLEHKEYTNPHFDYLHKKVWRGKNNELKNAKPKNLWGYSGPLDGYSWLRRLITYSDGSTSYANLDVTILRGGENYQIPLHSTYRKDGVLDYQMPFESYDTTMSYTALMDLCKYHKLNLGTDVIIRGGTFIPTVKIEDVYEDNVYIHSKVIPLKRPKPYLFETCYNIFIMRFILKYIAKITGTQPPGLEKVYKLLGNSGYGKNNQKHYGNEKRFFNNTNEDSFVEAMLQAYRQERVVNVHHNEDGHFLTIDKGTMEKSYSHCGDEILSQSKSLTYRIREIFEYLNIKYVYTDTDSIIATASGFSKVIEEYNKRYGDDCIRILDGFCEGGIKNYTLVKYRETFKNTFMSNYPEHINKFDMDKEFEKFIESTFSNGSKGLVGKFIGQLHNDIDVPLKKGESIKEFNERLVSGEIGYQVTDEKEIEELKKMDYTPFVVDGIFLGKKAYCLKAMYAYFAPDGKVYAYKWCIFKLKSVSKGAIKHASIQYEDVLLENVDESEFDNLSDDDKMKWAQALYLLNDGAITYVLNTKDDAPRFESDPKNPYSIRSREIDTFIRKVKFFKDDDDDENDS